MGEAMPEYSKTHEGLEILHSQYQCVIKCVSSTGADAE